MGKFFLTLLIVISSIIAEPLYVKSRYAKLRRHPAERKGCIKVPRGTALEKISYRNKWYKVKYKGKNRWIYRSRVTKKMPMQDYSLMNRYGEKSDAWELLSNSDTRHIPNCHKYFAKHNKISRHHQIFVTYHKSYIVAKNKRHYRLITKYEPITYFITLEHSEKFLEEGKLAEYTD